MTKDVFWRKLHCFAEQTVLFLYFPIFRKNNTQSLHCKIGKKSIGNNSASVEDRTFNVYM